MIYLIDIVEYAMPYIMMVIAAYSGYESYKYVKGYLDNKDSVVRDD